MRCISSRRSCISPRERNDYGQNQNDDDAYVMHHHEPGRVDVHRFTFHIHHAKHFNFFLPGLLNFVISAFHCIHKFTNVSSSILNCLLTESTIISIHFYCITNLPSSLNPSIKKFVWFITFRYPNKRCTFYCILCTNQITVKTVGTTGVVVKWKLDWYHHQLNLYVVLIHWLFIPAY